MQSEPMKPWMTGPLPAAGACPWCGRVAGGERCTHCGVAVRVGPYRVRQVLGERGAGRTYLADDTDGPVVLKELSFVSEPSPEVLQAFHEEARQLQGLTHPRIPRYLDLLQLGLGAQTRLYLVQEFIEGMSLEAELAARHLTEHEARELARQALDILGYLQGRSPQVFHGDLKPANLIRREDGALFLVDFGAGWVRGRASSEASHYTPPEQMGGELDATTDLFSLGITLMEALSWATDGSLLKATASQLVSRLQVGADLQQFLARLTCSDPAQRFASAEAALWQLETPPSAPRASRTVQAQRLAVGAVAAAVLFGSGFVMGRLTARNPRLVPPQMEDSAPPARMLPQRPLPPPSPLSSGALREEWVPLHHPGGCEFAFGRGASASSSLDVGPPEGAFDHNPSTLWHTPRFKDAWLQVDLKGLVQLDALVLDWSWDTRFGDGQGVVMTSLDGSHWQPLLRVSSPSEKSRLPHRMWFPERTARFVRFASGLDSSGWVHVRSLELYGPSCPLPSSKL